MSVNATSYSQDYDFLFSFNISHAYVNMFTCQMTLNKHGSEKPFSFAY